MTLSSRTPSPSHLAYRRALEEAMRRHGQELDAVELLAITSHLVGQLIAMMDQRAITPQMAMAVVSQNIEHGNRQVIDQLLGETGGHA